MDIANRTKTFTVKDKSYSVTYPTVGQFFEIEAQKSSLSKGQFGGMLDSGTVMAHNAIEIICIVAFLKVMCPKLLGTLNEGVDRIEDIDLLDFKEIKDAYNSQIKPWYEAWYKIYTGDKGEGEKE